MAVVLAAVVFTAAVFVAADFAAAVLAAADFAAAVSAQEDLAECAASAARAHSADFSASADRVVSQAREDLEGHAISSADAALQDRGHSAVREALPERADWRAPDLEARLADSPTPLRAPGDLREAAGLIAAGAGLGAEDGAAAGEATLTHGAVRAGAAAPIAGVVTPAGDGAGRLEPDSLLASVSALRAFITPILQSFLFMPTRC